MRMNRTGYVAVLAAVAVALAAGPAIAAKGPSAGGGGGSAGGGGKPAAETVGNNLSFPVEWSEVGWSLALPGTMTTASIAGVVKAGTYTIDDLTPCLGALQKDALNVWQAENVVASSKVVTEIDWGDNLESKDWRVGQVVRVETGLYDSSLGAPMTRYEMCYISGSGTSEVWGLRVTDNGDGTYAPVTTQSTTAMVFTAAARLTIQRIDPQLAEALTWDAATHAWIGAGALGSPVLNAATHEKVADGPGAYGAELNVQGKVVYGYVWTTKGLTAGEYRLTFSLDQPPTFSPGVSLAGATIMGADAVTTETGGNTAVVRGADELTFIDVGLTGGSGGSGRR